MEQPTTRRGFLAFVTSALAAVPLLGGAFLALRAALAPAKADRPQRLPLCRLSEVEGDALLVRPVSYQMRRGPKVESVSQIVFVTRDGDRVIAMAGECTHLACPVQMREVAKTPNGDAPLACPCHGGKFSRTGEVLDGPPRFPLRRLQIEVPEGDDGMIWLLET